MHRRAFLTGMGLTAGAVALGLAGCTSDGSDDAGRVGGISGTVLETPLPKPTVVLQDTTGAPYDFAEATAGKMAMLFFGYTSCPDVCPVTLGIVASALDKVRPDGVDPTVAFVGVDTARDTPTKLREYLDRYDPRFVGLTGTPTAIDEAMAQVNLPAAVIDPDGEGGDDYTVVHPSNVLVFTPDDLCHVMYGFGTRQQTWVDELPRIQARNWSAA
jgi:protein SCO1/2